MLTNDQAAAVADRLIAGIEIKNSEEPLAGSASQQSTAATANPARPHAVDANQSRAGELTMRSKCLTLDAYVLRGPALVYSR